MFAPSTGSLIRRVHGAQGALTGPTLAPECGAPARAGKSWPLLLPIWGFRPPDDEYLKATVLSSPDELTQDATRPALPSRENRQGGLSKTLLEEVEADCSTE